MLTRALRQTTARHPDKVAFTYKEQSWTYAEIGLLTDQFARNLLAAGIVPGDRVALHLENRPELAFAFLACLKAGFIAVPINPRLKGPEIDYILRHSGAAFYAGQPDLYATLKAASPAIHTIELRLLTDGPAADGTVPFDEVFRQTTNGSVALPDVPAERVAVILYTSGSTARPKGVTHSHESLTRMAECMREMHLDDEQVVLIMSSMAHLVGLGMLFLSSMLNGATTVITRQMEFAANLEAFEKRGCTFTVALPVMFDGLARTQAAAPRNVECGRYFYCGGDSVSAALQESFAQAMGPALEVYGSTEIAPVTWNRAGTPFHCSIGLPGAQMSLRLVGRDGREVSQGTVGEISVRGPHLMTGYWRDPEATASAVVDGWFRTGDLAWQGESGEYYFAGRLKEVIIRGGSNISPQEVEAALYDHPAVMEAGVIGCPDALWGETVVAYVALRPGLSVTESELIGHARERVADYKTPERIFFLDHLPKGPSGKILRRALREAALAPTA
jgi:long-chain acyl-CoA synthetase